MTSSRWPTSSYCVSRPWTAAGCSGGACPVSDESTAGLRGVGSTAALRVANETRVLELLAGVRRGSEPASLSQAEIARRTGLSSGTVSSIVRTLAGRGEVRTDAGRGRRGSRVRLAAPSGLVAGVHWTFEQVAV